MPEGWGGLGNSFFQGGGRPEYREGQGRSRPVQGQDQTQGQTDLWLSRYLFTFVNMPPKIHNRKPLKKFRTELRNNLTPAEATLWSALQKRQLEGRKFRRQHSIGKYIADFYCPSEKLVVEADGAGHFTLEGSDHDEIRDSYLNSLGIKVVRIENRDIFNNLEAVLEEIKRSFKS